jgi:hypothetical protein
VGFNRAKPQESVELYRVFHIVLEVMYVGLSGDRHIYASLIKERYIHLEKCARFGSYNRSDFAKFVCNCNSLSGPLSSLREP